MTSLTRWLQLGILAAQAIAIVFAMVLFPALAPFVTYDDIGDMTARRLLMSALKKMPDGSLKLLQKPDLLLYASRRPHFAYAVIDRDTLSVAYGSDEALALAVLRMAPLFPAAGGNLKSDRPGFPEDSVLITPEQTELGTLIFVTAGNKFHLSDVGSFVWTFLPIVLPTYGPVLLAVLVVVPLFVRRALDPLTELAAKASRIDISAPERQLPLADAPAEFRPLISSVNLALERLDQGMQRQKRYAANAAHELRTPLAILKARVGSLSDRHSKPELQRDVQRMESLLEQLLAAARLDQLTLDLTEEVELSRVCKAIIADRAPLAARLNKYLALKSEVEPITVRGNAKAIESAIANLIDNAIDAEPDGGTVLIRITATASIEVIDHGPGVPRHLRSVVFEPFWRGSDRTSGTGLGLAIVHEIADRHGASVSISETEGGGATFRLDLTACICRKKSVVEEVCKTPAM